MRTAGRAGPGQLPGLGSGPVVVAAGGGWPGGQTREAALLSPRWRVVRRQGPGSHGGPGSPAQEARGEAGVHPTPTCLTGARRVHHQDREGERSGCPRGAGVATRRTHDVIARPRPRERQSGEPRSRARWQTERRGSGRGPAGPGALLGSEAGPAPSAWRALGCSPRL